MHKRGGDDTSWPRPEIHTTFRFEKVTGPIETRRLRWNHNVTNEPKVKIA